MCKKRNNQWRTSHYKDKTEVIVEDVEHHVHIYKRVTQFILTRADLYKLLLIFKAVVVDKHFISEAEIT